MDDRKVMISEAARLVDVESHVLRYWEDELHIPVKRTTQGHRYYTKEDLQLFHCIKRLKDETVSIKELKQIVPELLKAQRLNSENGSAVESAPDANATTPSTSTASALTDSSDQTSVKMASTSSSNFTGTSAESGYPNTESSGAGIQTKKGTSPEISGTDTANQALTPTSPTEVIEDLPLKQARELIGAVLCEVVTDNNKVLTSELRQTLTADIMQEMDFLVQAKERKEEDHFRKLDQLIRQQQSIRRETVGHANPLLRLKRLLT